jgi:hypothetical protein
MRHALTAIEAAILPRGPSLMIAPDLEIRLGPLCDRRIEMQTSQPRGIDDGEQNELDHQGSVERQALNADVSEGDEHSSPDRLRAAAINRSTSASVKYSLGLCLALATRRSVRFAVVGAASVIVEFSCVGALQKRAGPLFPAD